jgi:predicted RNase H-like HicB family nuclease
MLAAEVATMKFAIEFEREADGRWIAEIPDMPGVLVYGDTQADARAKVEALARQVIADKLQHA